MSTNESLNSSHAQVEQSDIPPIQYCWNSIFPYELLNHCEAKKDPETGDYVLGLYSTQDPPPEVMEGYAICRDINNNKWVHLPDYRGKFYWTKDMSWNDPGLPILYPGELPEGASLNPPMKPSHILRTELKFQIRDLKRKKRNAGVVVDKVLFDTDYNAELAYISFVDNTRHNSNYVKRWRASTEVWVDMTRDLCLKVKKAVDEYIDNVYKWQELKEIELSNTPDDQLHNFEADLLSEYQKLNVPTQK